MFSKKIVTGTQNGNEIPYVVPMNPTTEEYLEAKAKFEALGFERNVSKSSDGYGDLGKQNSVHYASNGMVYKKSDRKIINP